VVWTPDARTDRVERMKVLGRIDNQPTALDVGPADPAV